MPYYSDVPYYYGGSYANHSSLMTGSGRPFTPLSRYSPHLSTISESPLSHLHRYSPISVSRPRRVIDTADIDVSTPRIFSHDVSRPRNRLRRDRPTVKIRSQALKDNPALREHHERHEKSVSELLMEKFLIKDKKPSGEEPQVRLYHQVSLDRDESSQENETAQKKIMRRFTRRRSSADLQLDAEQMKREATYAQVQAKVLDSLVAEEQAQIESEVRRGTLIRKGTVRGPRSRSYYSSNTESDTMTQEEEEEEEEEEKEKEKGEEEEETQRMRKTMKKVKKKKKKMTDQSSSPDHRGDKRRSSTSSEMSTDSRIDEEENDGPRPQMYKIEACNSAGDFSTIWMNASENERPKLSVEQFRESVRVPIPRKLGGGSNAESSPPAPKSPESETRIVLPVRKPYVKDSSRHSVYLTVRKPSDRLDEKIDAIAKDDDNQTVLTNGFVDGETLKNANIPTSEDSPKLNGEVQQASDSVKDIEDAQDATKRKKIAAKPKKTELARKDVHSVPKSLDDEDSRGKRDTVISRTKNDAWQVGDATASNTETASASIQSETSAFVSTNAQVKQPSKAVPVAAVKKDGARKDDHVVKKVPEAPAIGEAAKGSTPSRVDKHADKEKERASDAPKIPAMLREDVTTRRSVVSLAGDTSENSASVMPTLSATYLPKVSKINADRNNAVEAPELSLREATYLANATKCERAEDVGAALPGKKVDKASSLANNASSTTDVEKKASGANTCKSATESARDDAAKCLSKAREATLPEGPGGKVRSNECEIAKPPADANPAKDVALAKTPRSETEVSLTSGVSADDAPKDAGSPKLADAKKVGAVDLKKDPSRDPGQFSPKAQSKVGAESKLPFKLKTLPPKVDAGETGGADSSKVGKDASALLKATRNDDERAAPSVPKKNTEAPRFPKKSISVDSSVSTTTPAPSDAGTFKILQQSVSVDEKVVNKSMPVKEVTEFTPLVSTNAQVKQLAPSKAASVAAVKKDEPLRHDNAVKKGPEVTAIGETAKVPAGKGLAVPKVDKHADKELPTSKAIEKKKKKQQPLTLDLNREKLQEENGQLSKSASTESIDFWSEIKAPDSPQAARACKPGGLPREATVTPKIEEKTEPMNLKWIPSDPPSGKSAPIKELGGDDKKNESGVKISVALGSSAVGRGNVAEEKTTEKVVPESPKAKAETAKTTLQKTVQKAPRKRKNLSIAIGGKDPNATVKRAPLKREDSAHNQSDSSGTTVASTPASEEPTPVAEVTVPLINIVEVPRLPGSERQSVSEECEDASTPTNEPVDSSLIKISKWSKRDDLTNADDGETPVASEETSLAASPAASPQSSKTKRAVKKKKKSSTKKQPNETNETKEAKETKKDDNEAATTNDQQDTVKPSNKQLLSKPSPRSSPRNSPSQRPLDLIKMFYTTPSALLTATPRDLSKVRRAKIKRRRHHSRTPSVSSDSTGSTTSTATTESTDGSGSTCTELDDDAEHKRMNSTRSNDSGFDGSPRISNCDMACHKKCEKLTGNLCGLNQKMVAEALQALKRAPSQSSDNQRNSSDTSDHFPSGRITPPATNLPRFKKYAVTDFNFLKVLGKGSFGKVLLAELRGTECVYAVKCLKKDVVLEDDDVECTLIERKVLTLATRHPYLCHLFCTFQTDSHLFFVMEYLNGGDLMFHIQKSGRFPETRARFYAAEIWSGLNFLHKKGIVYRDLKLDNVLLDFDGHIRIADFGMCKLQIFLDRTADTFCGTPDYMAPEIIKGLKYNQAVDWWSYGVLLYEMLTGQSPFSGCDEDELFWSICNERPFIPRYLSQEATDILVCLLEKDSGKRPPGHEIAMHAFFQNLPWDRLERRQLDAPFKPALDHTLDTRYFDTAFTTERPRLTPVPEQILTSMDQGVFRGFSYTNPNATD